MQATTLKKTKDFKSCKNVNIAEKATHASKFAVVNINIDYVCNRYDPPNYSVSQELQNIFRKGSKDIHTGCNVWFAD